MNAHVLQLVSYLLRPNLATVIHAMVISRVDSCNSLSVGLPLRVTRKLQLIQNTATGTFRREYTINLARTAPSGVLNQIQGLGSFNL